MFTRITDAQRTEAFAGYAKLLALSRDYRAINRMCHACRVDRRIAARIRTVHAARQGFPA